MKLFTCPICGQSAVALDSGEDTSNGAGVDQAKCTSPRAYKGEAGWICPDLDEGAAAAIHTDAETAMAPAAVS
jgi:hypothetical protein